MLFYIIFLTGLIFAFGNDYKPEYHAETVDELSELAEGPYWDEGHQRLYYVDMRNMWVISYNPENRAIFKAKVVSDKKPVTLVVRMQGTEDMFVVALKGALAMMKWDGNSNVDVKPVEFLDIEDPASGSRCNDGKVDPANRLWVGTMGAQTKSDPDGNEFEKDKGNLFRIDHNGKKNLMVDKMQIPNGLDWSKDKKKFYLVDSLSFDVAEYDYNDEDGSIANRKVLYDFKKAGLVGTKDKPNTLPDGMTLDDQGFLWVAVYGTGKVVRISPSGEKVFEILLDKVLQPTSVCFGGKDLDILFVTTAHVDWTNEYKEKYPKSGYLFKITNLEVKGKAPSTPVKLSDDIIEVFHKNQHTKTQQ